MPDLRRAVTPDMYRWLGQVAHLIELTCGQTVAIQFRVAMQDVGKFQSTSSETLLAIVFEALGRAEYLAPASYSGSYIAVKQPDFQSLDLCSGISLSRYREFLQAAFQPGPCLDPLPGVGACPYTPVGPWHLSQR
jgi:hypothetical protein